MSRDTHVPTTASPCQTLLGHPMAVPGHWCVLLSWSWLELGLQVSAQPEVSEPCHGHSSLLPGEQQSKESAPATPAMGWCEGHSQEQAPEGLAEFLGEIPTCKPHLAVAGRGCTFISTG